jgi:PAS domain S-box-containing protein
VATAPRGKDLVLILTRELATNLATAMFITDADGNLVFYNEAAEGVVGQRFAEAGEMPLAQWLDAFEPRDSDSTPLPAERRPTQIAFVERRAAHEVYLVTSADGVEREVEVSAFPLFAHAEEFVGVVAIFWRR